MGTLLWNPQALCGWSEYVQQKKPTEALFKFVNLKAISLRNWPWSFIWIEGLASLWKLVASLSHSVLLTCVVFFPHAVTYTNVTVILLAVANESFQTK